MTAKKKPVPAKFPLRLMPSLSEQAKRVSAREGVSLNQFINIAVAEKVAHAEHEAWLERRAKIPAYVIDRARAIVDRPSSHPVEPGDELPAGYTRMRTGSNRAASTEKARA